MLLADPPLKGQDFRQFRTRVVALLLWYLGEEQPDSRWCWLNLALKSALELFLET